MDFGGGFGKKVHDLIGAHMCHRCHAYTDSLSRDKAQKWEHSEEFEFLILKTLLRLWEQGIIGLKG